MLRTFRKDLPGVLAIQTQMYMDERGCFFEGYKQEEYARIGIHGPFRQCNFSLSSKGTLRGLHHQLKQPQGKLCIVLNGDVLDVVVDIRRDSPTFGHHITQRLSSDSVNSMYIPAGYSHGFLALTNDVIFTYFCTTEYSGADDQHGVRWNDPELNIPWGIADPILSPKDKNLPLLSEIPNEILPV